MPEQSIDPQTTRSIALRWMAEIWRPGSLQTFDELHSPEFRDYSPSGRETDRDAYRKGIQALYAAFPDFTAVVEDLLVDEQTGKAVIRWSAAGTQYGAFMGRAPRGKLIHFQGIEIITVRGGQIVERWGEWDGLGLLEQLGAI